MTNLLIIIGGVVMISAGFLAALAILLIVSSFSGIYAHRVYKRLCRTYALHTVWYWMQRVEKEGRRTFEKAPDTDDY